MWRKLIGLALGLELLTAMLLSTATPGAASESPASVWELNIAPSITSGFGKIKVPPEITVNSAEQMQLTSRKTLLALETIHFKPFKNSTNSNAAFNTFHAGFDNPSDIFCDLPVPEDPLSEAYLHSNSLGVTFPLKAAIGQAGLVGQGNGFVQKAVFYDTLLYLPGCPITETYLAWIVRAGASITVANQLLSDCTSRQTFLPPAFPQITPVNKALVSFDPLAKQTDKAQTSSLGLIDLTLIPAAISARLPKLCSLTLTVPHSQGGARYITKVNRKDLII